MSRSRAFRRIPRTASIALSIPLAVWSAGCRGPGTKPPPVTAVRPRAHGRGAPGPELVAGQQAFLGGHPAVAIGHFNLHQGEAAEDDGGDEVAYWLGLCELRLNHPRRALAYFDHALRPGAHDDVTALALLAAGHAAYRLHALGRALAYYDRLSGPLLERVPADETMYRRALTLRRSGRWDEAVALFRRVAVRFPNSPRAADARREANQPHRYFACQIGWFGKRRNADNLTKTARRLGFDAAVVPGVRKGGAGFAVMVGRYARFADAQQAVARLRRSGFDAFVVP